MGILAENSRFWYIGGGSAALNGYGFSRPIWKMNIESPPG